MSDRERRLHRRLAITNVTLVLASTSAAIRAAQNGARAACVLSLLVALFALAAGISDAIRAVK